MNLDHRLPNLAPLATALAASLCLAGAASGQPTTPVNPVDTTKEGAATVREVSGLAVPGPTSQEDIKPALAALERMVAAYRKAPPMVDDLELHVYFMGQGSRNNPQRISVATREGEDVAVKMPNSRLLAADGEVLYEHARFDSRYLNVPVEGTVLDTFVSKIGMRPTIGWHTVARCGGSPSELIASLSFALPSAATVAGHERVTIDGDRAVDRVTLRAKEGWSVVTIDAATGFVIGVDMDFVPPGAPVETARQSIHVRSRIDLEGDADALFAFEPGIRRKVSNLFDLRGMAIVNERARIGIDLGDAMPELTGVTIEGVPWTLAEKRGRIQVLIFWNLQSIRFRQGIAAIQQLTAQVGDSVDGVPVDFMLVNTMDRSDVEEKWDEVYDYWYDSKVGIPCLFDETDVIGEAVGIRNMPSTLVIGADGRLAATQRDLESRWIMVMEAILARVAKGQIVQPGPLNTTSGG